jgi:lipid-A-disaccharide synthase
LQAGPEFRSFNNKIVLVTGELSGEIHALHLVKAITRLLPIKFSGVGSTRLAEAGVRIIYDYGRISLTGLSEIFVKLRYIREAYGRLKKHLIEEKPSLIILVDFPGFNLKIAHMAKKEGIPVIYFIPPQLWAWRESRIKKIKKFVDHVICILPFEKAFYDSHGVDVTYIGHPFTDIVKPKLGRQEFLDMVGAKEGDAMVTIMPGSRENEFTRHMPLLLEVADELVMRVDNLKVLLPLADSIEDRIIQKYSVGRSVIPIRGLSYDALSYSDTAIMASGSATLEAAILGTPTIVVYKVSKLSYVVAKALVKVKYISLPNIIMGEEIFPEFIQHISTGDIVEKTLYMLKNGRKGLEKRMTEIKRRLSSEDSYHLAGESIVRFLEDRYGAIF